MSLDLEGAGGESGQATVELAVVMPFLFLLLLALVQTGLIGLRRITVASAAREGARAAAVTSDVREVREAALGAAPVASSLEVHVAGERTVGEPVTVTVVDRVKPSVPLVSALFPDEIGMTASARMAVEVP